MESRYVYNNENDIVMPDESIACKDCAFRDKELKDGYKRSRCKKYEDRCKPLDVLFKNGKCEFYKTER